MRRPLLVAALTAHALVAACGSNNAPVRSCDQRPPCADGGPLSVLPIAATDYVNVTVLGNINPPGHVFPSDHPGFYLRREALAGGSLGAPVTTPLLAPADLEVVRIERYGPIPEGATEPSFRDYALSACACRDVLIKIGHVTSLAPALESAVSQWNCAVDDHGTGDRSESCWAELSATIASGAALGTAGGRAGQWGLDFGAFDRRMAPLSWANPARHPANPTGFDDVHVACPWELFAEPLRSQLRARLGWTPQPGDPRGFVPRTAEPWCGAYMQDVPGTLQGRWYRSDATVLYDWSTHLAFSRDTIDPRVVVFSHGDPAAFPGIGMAANINRPSATGTIDRDPALVTPDGGIFCYQVAGAVRLLARLEDATRLTIETQPGDCAPTGLTFTAAARHYAR